MRLAARHPELIKSLALLETSANAEPQENLPQYKLLNGMVRWLGIIPPIASKVMKIMFAKSWLADPTQVDSIRHWKKELASNKKSIIGPVEGVIYRKGERQRNRHPPGCQRNFTPAQIHISADTSRPRTRRGRPPHRRPVPR